MATIPTAAWATPGTALFGTGGGGGSNFPLGITYGISPQSKLTTTNVFGNAFPAILDMSNNPQSLVAETFISRLSTSSVATGNYEPDRIFYQQSGSGTGRTFVQTNDAALQDPNNKNYFNLLGISTINAGANTADAVALLSSLKGTFPVCFQ